ncbi:ABC transporter, ATP-binding protein [Marvinbryantia formatexigens DSM 14469]|uniref:Nickel import system ATP-binding protein NikD n=1 Tax=Marvinbryantia formatexigens DSM 14469 TaxID=478749 RepID=C6LB13_9FIRM|nr:ABC transporter ATP-binding protein [Marvinbryantia formatexigens]EET62144.1 ABC transporter, ATP-binding protein [Marvinbryantia formatexigens DSM 14469]UWO26511.1 ABC transporter ATP-binding protein [Marvinbryantia formatexigens DSM 14469]SDF77937.1 oligopeptide/dipeptide ABC transporter, ATP-binding protein, C-terminal domain-containing protein [Marvinbryantia formatexigens]
MSKDIEIRNLCVSFPEKNGVSQVVTDVHALFGEGVVTGLIGESGSGKSVLGMSILQLLPKNAVVEGSCMYEGRNLYNLTQEEMRKIRGQEIALIPQNPSESLNPIRRIGKQLIEGVTAHKSLSRKEARNRRDALLVRFGFPEPEKINRAYTFQLSGGMNQRVISALGLMEQPEWVIADEPTKGLDAILRRQVYRVLKEISEQETRGMIVITHDIALAGALCKRLMVLYKGTVLEQGETAQILENPAHPYTQGLIASLPEKGMHPIRRADPGKISETKGCRFYPRCPYGTEKCRKTLPPEIQLPDGRLVRCNRYAGDI